MPGWPNKVFELNAEMSHGLTGGVAQQPGGVRGGQPRPGPRDRQQGHGVVQVMDDLVPGEADQSLDVEALAGAPHSGTAPTARRRDRPVGRTGPRRRVGWTRRAGSGPPAGTGPPRTAASWSHQPSSGVSASSMRSTRVPNTCQHAVDVTAVLECAPGAPVRPGAEPVDRRALQQRSPTTVAAWRS